MREKVSDAVRTNFAAHLYSEPFAKLGRHPRIIRPVEQLFGEKLYMHQFKINGKMAFEGDVWQWHQDYGTWKNDDLMPDARAMNVANFLQDVECLSDDCLTWPCAVDLPWRNGMPGSALETSDDVIALAR